MTYEKTPSHELSAGDSPDEYAIIIQPEQIGRDSLLKGNLIRHMMVQKNIDYLYSLNDQATTAGSYAHLLAGESSVSNPPAGQGSISDKKILFRQGMNEKRYTGFGAALAGHDYQQLSDKNPNGRYKFYSSFDLTTPEKKALGEGWFTDLARQAYDEGLTLTTKSFEHAYDSLNVYTWHPAEIAKIITKLYPRYRDKGLYYDTPHFFQAALPTVNPNHVGVVQEPAGGTMSHSARMGRLGTFIDRALQHQGELSRDAYCTAARQAGVNPERPYLVESYNNDRIS